MLRAPDLSGAEAKFRMLADISSRRCNFITLCACSTVSLLCVASGPHSEETHSPFRSLVLGGCPFETFSFVLSVNIRRGKIKTANFKQNAEIRNMLHTKVKVTESCDVVFFFFFFWHRRVATIVKH